LVVSTLSAVPAPPEPLGLLGAPDGAPEAAADGFALGPSGA
jgi:hypothetical protein